MRNSWIFLSFLGLFSLSVMTLILTYLVRKGLSTVFVLFVMTCLLIFAYAFYAYVTKSFPSSIPSNLWALLVIASVLSFIGNLAIYKATAISPNPGLVLTIFGLQAGIVSIGAVWLFKDKLNSLQILGILLGIIAIIIIGLGSRSNKNSNLVSPETEPTNIANKSLDI